MRKNIVAGNWKMNTLLHDGLELANTVNRLAENKISNAIVVIAPPFTHLYEITYINRQHKPILGRIE